MEHNGGTLDGVLSNADLSSSAGAGFVVMTTIIIVIVVTVSSPCHHHHYNFQLQSVVIDIFFGPHSYSMV